MSTMNELTIREMRMASGGMIRHERIELFEPDGDAIPGGTAGKDRTCLAAKPDGKTGRVLEGSCSEKSVAGHIKAAWKMIKKWF